MLFALPSHQEQSSTAVRPDLMLLGAAGKAAVLVLLLSLTVSTAINHRLIRPLASLYSEVGRDFPLPLRTYLTVTHLTAWWATVAIVLVALAFWRARALRPALVCVATLAALNTLMGLCSVADTAVQYAVQLELWKAQVMVERDLATLHLAAGQSRAAIDLMDPGRKGDYPAGTFGAAGKAFQLGEASRLAGDVDTARRLYHRAQEAAILLDESTRRRPDAGGNDLVDLFADFLRAHSILSPDEPWQTEEIRELRRLPAAVQVASELRLRQLLEARTPKP